MTLDSDQSHSPKKSSQRDIFQWRDSSTQKKSVRKAVKKAVSPRRMKKKKEVPKKNVNTDFSSHQTKYDVLSCLFNDSFGITFGKLLRGNDEKLQKYSAQTFIRSRRNQD